jgi:F-type H+-transporting ATPase subunit alpha
MLSDLLRETRNAIEGALEEAGRGPRIRETGTVLHVGGGVARVDGLPGLEAEALVEFPGHLTGIAVNLEPGEAGIVLLGSAEHLRAGDEARVAGSIVDTPVGAALLGRVIDARGRPLDDKPPPRAAERRPIERAAPAIMDRAPVSEPLQTGLKVVDALIPIGRGQRELILGDRQTGKTTIAVDTILNQHGRDVV